MVRYDITCPEPELLDSYVLGGGAGDREQIEAHVQTCPFCRVLLVDRVQYYQRLLQVARPAPGSHRVPEVISLNAVPIDRAEPMSEVRQAAAGLGQETASKAKTFLSDDQKWMLKSLPDPQDGHLRLFLLSDAGEPVSGVLIRLSQASEPLITDAEGSIDLDMTDLPQDPSKIEIVMPAASFVLKAVDHLLMIGSSTLIQSQAGDTIRVSIEHSEAGYRLRLEVIGLSQNLQGRRLRLLVSPSTRPQLIPLEPVLVIDDFEIPGQMEILLFP